MELGGWKSYEIVLRYAHLAPEHLSSAAKRTDVIGTSWKRTLRFPYVRMDVEFVRERNSL
jgi:hypothetical protein